MVLDQGAHDLLWRLGGTDIRNDETAVGFLCIADPTYESVISKLN